MIKITSLFQCKGVKNATVLALHKPFDICRGMVIDVLHCLFLGVSLKLLNLWFSKDTRMESSPCEQRSVFDLIIMDNFYDEKL